MRHERATASGAGGGGERTVRWKALLEEIIKLRVCSKSEVETWKFAITSRT